MILKTLAMVAATVVSGVVFAGVERNFVGTTGGEFGVAANWSGSTLPGDGDTAIIPNGVTVNVSSSDSVAALKAVSFLKLNGSTAKLSIVGQSVDFDGGKPQLLGAGVFSAEATSGTSVAIKLRQDNSDYTGSFSFKGVTTYAFGPKTVGGANACPISQTMLDNGDMFHFAEKGNYYGPIALDAATTWQGLAVDATATGVITNFGALTVSVGHWSAGARFSQNSSYDFVQRGKIAMATSGRFDINVNKAGRLWLDCEAEFKNADDDFFADTATIGTIVLGPNFCLKKGRMQTNGGNGFVLEGENPFTRAGGARSISC